MKHRREPEPPMHPLGCGLVLLLGTLCWAVVIGLFFYMKSLF